MLTSEGWSKSLSENGVWKTVTNLHKSLQYQNQRCANTVRKKFTLRKLNILQTITFILGVL